MRPHRQIPIAILILCILIFISAFIIVSYRDQYPEWRKYQLQGVSLAISRLNSDLETEQQEDKRKTINVKLVELHDFTPQVIEIRPFGGKLPGEFCMTCHYGIEDTSTSHPNSVFGCVICHGGAGSDLTVKGAHRGLIGKANPTRLDLAAQSCGGSSLTPGMCHTDKLSPILDRVRNTPRSIMATNAGIIGILRFQWGVTDIGEDKYGIKPVSDGKKDLVEIGPEVARNSHIHLAESHFRKFCSACHLWGKQPEEKMGRLEGCAACHADYDHTGR
ncbi:MAG: hypothetical protein NTY51_13550, partial [Deltaproteobacteria bacterium]|nr:hypothetical protein [Deltaproteobacteria bacterium]